MFASFIDVQKTNNTADNTLLWKALAPLGVPLQMITAIRQFPDEVKARMRNDNGACSDEFDVAQGFRQGCSILPLLFSILTTILLTVQ